jgi:hypothetical protein
MRNKPIPVALQGLLGLSHACLFVYVQRTELPSTESCSLCECDREITVTSARAVSSVSYTDGTKAEGQSNEHWKSCVLKSFIKIGRVHSTHEALQNPC